MSRMISLGNWMLSKLARGPYVDAVAGDLAEGVARGRGVGWYWRQVFAAIGTAWWGGVCARRGRILFAAMWGALWPAWCIVETLITGWWLRGTVELALRPRLVLMLGQSVLLNVTYVWVGLLVYLAMDRERWCAVPLRRFVRGWATCFGVFVGGKIVLLFGVSFLIWKVGAAGFAAAPYFRWNHWAGEPVMAVVSLLVGIGVMLPVRRDRLKRASAG